MYYEKVKKQKLRPVEVAAPQVVAYHASVNTDRSAVDHFTVAPEAYSYIEGRINNTPPAATLPGKKVKSPPRAAVILIQIPVGQ